jgi:hypothetical protein
MPNESGDGGVMDARPHGELPLGHPGTAAAGLQPVAEWGGLRFQPACSLGLDGSGPHLDAASPMDAAPSASPRARDVASV